MISLGIVMAENGHDVEYVFALSHADMGELVEALRLYEPLGAESSRVRGMLLSQMVTALYPNLPLPPSGDPTANR